MAAFQNGGHQADTIFVITSSHHYNNTSQCMVAVIMSAASVTP